MSSIFDLRAAVAGAAETAQCRCHAGAAESAPELAARILAEWEERYGESLGQELHDAARGRGDLAGLVVPVVHGSAGECAQYSRAGDFIVGSDLFPDSAPRIELVGLGGASEFGESSAFTEDDQVAILRPYYGENAAVIGALASGAGQALAARATDPFAPVTSMFTAVRSGLGAVRDAIDTGYRVVQMAQDIRSAYGPLNWQGSNQLRLQANYEPANLGQRTNVWTFTIACKIRPEDSTPARFPFQVVVTNNCFSIMNARIVPQSPDVPRTPFSEEEEGLLDDLSSGAAWLGNRVVGAVTAPVRGAANIATRMMGTHRLTIRSEVDTTQHNNFPYQAAFNIHGTWDPADAGDLRDDFAGQIVVRSDGSVLVNLSSTRLVSATRPRMISGESLGTCTPQYEQTRQLVLEQGGRAPGAGRAGGSSGGRAGGGGSWRGTAQGLVPDPPRGKHIFFATNRGASTAEIQSLLQEWWAALPVHLQSALQAGQTAVYVDGHADPTGSESRNRALSDQRAQTVGGILRALLPGARIIAAGHGSQVARSQGITGNDPTWRRVTVRLDIRG